MFYCLNRPVSDISKEILTIFFLVPFFSLWRMVFYFFCSKSFYLVLLVGTTDRYWDVVCFSCYQLLIIPNICRASRSACRRSCPKRAARAASPPASPASLPTWAGSVKEYKNITSLRAIRHSMLQNIINYFLRISTEQIPSNNFYVNKTDYKRYCSFF